MTSNLNPSEDVDDASMRAAYILRTEAAERANQHTEAFPIADRFAVQLNELRAQARAGKIEHDDFRAAALEVQADAYVDYQRSLRS